MKSFPHFFLPALLLLGGCAGVPPYGALERSMAEGRYEAAAKKVEQAQSKYSGRSRLVYYMDRLVTTQLAGQYRAANLYAEKAHRLMEALYTKSLSGEAMTWLFNDSGQDYKGEHFERVMVHLLAMVNYAMLGDPEEALVEARRADLRFREHARVWGGSVAYSEDALTRWLAGVMYEAQREPSEAFLDYKKTLEAFAQYQAHYGTPTPRQAVADAWRLAGSRGEHSYLKKLKKDFPGFDPAAAGANGGARADIVVLLYEGLAPRKRSASWSVPVQQDGYTQYFSVAYPVFDTSPRVLKSAVVEGPEGASEMELFQDIQSIAVTDLAERMGRIKAKAIARATAKFMAGGAIQAEQKSAGAKALAGLFTNIYALATEHADVRSWRTLPGWIHVARLRVKPGTHDVTLRLRTVDGREKVRSFPAVEAQLGVPALLRASVY